MDQYDILLAKLLGSGLIQGEGGGIPATGYDAELEALLGGGEGSSLSTGGLTFNFYEGEEQEKGGSEEEPEPGPAPGTVSLREVQIRSQSMRDGDVLLVNIEGFGEGVLAQVQDKDNFVRVVTRAVAQMPGARRPDNRTIADHPLNAKITRTKAYGYTKMLGKAGPLFSRGYNGLLTTKGSGRSYCVLFVMKEV